MQGLSLVVASGVHSSSRCAGLSLSRPLPLQSTGSRRTGSAVVAHGPSCSAARGILPDQGPNPCPLHWQADSQPLRHQGSPLYFFFINFFLYLQGQGAGALGPSSFSPSSFLCTFFKILFIFLYSRFLLVIHFIHISVYMSIPISQFFTRPPPPPTTLPR